MSRALFDVNEAVVIRFFNLPGNFMDWVGTYRAGTSSYGYVDWVYTEGAEDGVVSLPGLGLGSYEARLFFRRQLRLGAHGFFRGRVSTIRK